MHAKVINFVAWRAAGADRAKRQLIIQLLLSVLLGLGLMGGVAFNWQQRTAELHARWVQLQHVWHELQPQLTVLAELKQTISQIRHAQNIIATNQQRQRWHYQTLLWLAEHWPATARLTSLQFTHDAYELHGQIDTGDRLRQLIEQLRQLAYVQQVDFTDWQMIDRRQGQFTLHIRLVSDDAATV